MKDKKYSKAYNLSAKSNCLNAVGCVDKWYGISYSLALCEKFDNGQEMPKHPVIPQVWMIATDREAVKKELCRLVDGLFDGFEK